MPCRQQWRSVRRQKSVCVRARALPLCAAFFLLAQLRPYYEAPGSSETPAAADSRRQVLGLWLLHLLVTAARPQFYAEVELLSPADRASAYISFVLQLEACFAEGAHNRVRFCAQPRKAPHGAFFGAAFCSRRPPLPHVARAPPCRSLARARRS
jgi:hypothetical protein